MDAGRPPAWGQEGHEEREHWPSPSVGTALGQGQAPWAPPGSTCVLSLISPSCCLHPVPPRTRPAQAPARCPPAPLLLSGGAAPTRFPGSVQRTVPLSLAIFLELDGILKVFASLAGSFSRAFRGSHFVSASVQEGFKAAEAHLPTRFCLHAELRAVVGGLGFCFSSSLVSHEAPGGGSGSGDTHFGPGTTTPGQ